ncbi:NUDIX hydrolase [Microbacterium sp. H1-D42]|uniref:NUDIX hydrolase n=1 Tax=Microbacterium sp. H1-D42 TaxID=2925844 RepID=UPI001F531263|nr:NUDIX hydrolase [Microbacterium sp. H1-D42]UNK72184.1 NUDIX hydrolase [Microbacterium sp. H1-D42]
MVGGRPTPWQVVSSEQIVKDRWISLRADTCVDGEGRTISPYYVLDPSDWITVVALDEAGRVIAVEEYRHGAGIVAIGLVGGAVDDGEDPKDAALRELREETGYAAAEIIDLGSTWANWGNHTNRSHHFLARGCRRVTEQSLDDTEAIAVHVTSLDSLGESLGQSYHLLTWLKASQWLRAEQAG